MGVRKMSKRPVVLLGVAGAGKSTVGEKLARRMGRKFIELDMLAESRMCMSISEAFATCGEEYFRTEESHSLKGVLTCGNAVIAPGGGVLGRESNRIAIFQRGIISVWLDVPFPVVWERIKDTGDVRPLVRQGREFNRGLCTGRRPLYQLADIHIDASGDAGFVVENILRSIAILP